MVCCQEKYLQTVTLFWLPENQKIMPLQGLLCLEKDDTVVERKLRFCSTTCCTTNIASSLNNIRLLAGIILRDSSLNEILQAELDGMKD